MTGAAEGDIDTSPLRTAWRIGLLDRDEAVYLHQSLSKPCLDLVAHAEGPCLTTVAGRRLLDFHGNSVRQLGHGHPAVAQAI